MTTWIVLPVVLVVLLAAGGIAVYLGLVTGAVPLDLGVGRRHRALGPQTIPIAAPREVVFDIIAAPYLRRQPRAIAEKIDVLERGTDLVLAAHRTPVRGRLVAVTTETVRFTRPERVDFRLVRGPVPHLVEQFVLSDTDGHTTLTYTGELGTDLWQVGQWWGNAVAKAWEQTVARSLEAVRSEAERRADHPERRPDP